MRDDEHHLQTVRYKSDETRCELEAEKDGELMDWNIGKPESKPTCKEYLESNKRTNRMKLSMS